MKTIYGALIACNAETASELAAIVRAVSAAANHKKLFFPTVYYLLSQALNYSLSINVESTSLTSFYPLF